MNRYFRCLECDRKFGDKDRCPRCGSDRIEELGGVDGFEIISDLQLKRRMNYIRRNKEDYYG